MKYRIIRKKYKKNTLLNLWLNSMKDWNKVIVNISIKHNGILNVSNDDDYARYMIACDMSRYDWTNAIKVAEKMGFGYRTLNKYFVESYL